MKRMMSTAVGLAVVVIPVIFGRCSAPQPSAPKTSATDQATPPQSTPSTVAASHASQAAIAQMAAAAATGGPGRARPDVFHPANQPDATGNRPPMPAPVRGGRLIVHLESMPRHFNYMIENTGVTLWLLREVHEFLLQRDYDTWEHKPVLATGWDVEDALYLPGKQAASRVYGKVTEDGDDYVVTPISPKNPTSEVRRIKKAEVERVEKGTVFTFHLRQNVKFHDGKPLTTRDVYFSWQCYMNPTVDAEVARSVLGKVTAAEVIDDYTIRFFYDKQYFNAVDAFTNLTIVPSHVYNLSDKSNPDYDPKSDVLGRKQGQYVNENKHNREWVGLGPYRITEVNEQYIQAERFADYFNPDAGGYVDAIRWRYVQGDDAAKAALLNGEIDYWSRLRPEDYHGEFVQKPEFADHYYKGYSYLPRMQYVAWNMRRPLLAQQDVRHALAHCFDWDEFIQTQASGLGVRITATHFFLSPEYDRTVQPIAYNLDKARELLTAAGWYDRDNDGIIDKDGVKFEFEYLTSTGNKAAQTIALKMQENLTKVGIKLNIGTRDWAAFVERIRDKDFDAFGLSWSLDVENDPEQLWKSYGGEPGKDHGSNYPGVNDPEVDALIAQIQGELDKDKRVALFHQLHRRLYDIQPYMFTYTPPVKYAVSQRVRNFKGYGIDPGYRLREWYLVVPSTGAAATHP